MSVERAVRRFTRLRAAVTAVDRCIASSLCCIESLGVCVGRSVGRVAQKLIGQKNL